MEKVEVNVWVKRNFNGTVETMGKRNFVDGVIDLDSMDKVLLDEAIEIAKLLFTTESVTPNDENFVSCLMSNYALMCLCTGLEQTFKRIALVYSPEAATKALNKNSTYFQDLNNAKRFFNKNLGTTLTATFGTSWPKLTVAMRHSHKVRHVSPLISAVKEEFNGVTYNDSVDKFVEELIPGLEKATDNLKVKFK